MSAQQDFYSRICEAAGIDTVREQWGLAENAKLAGDVGGFELWQRVRDAAVGLLKELSPPTLTPDVFEQLKAAMNAAIDKIFTMIDWPYVPDAPVDFVLRYLANWSLDAAYNALKTA